MVSRFFRPEDSFWVVLAKACGNCIKPEKKRIVQWRADSFRECCTKAIVIQIVQWRADNFWVVLSEAYRNCMKSEDTQTVLRAQSVLVCGGKRHIKIVCIQMLF